MIIQIQPPARFQACLEHNHHALTKHLQHFEDRLFHLRYEGKPLLGKNICNTRETLRVLTREMNEHFKMEEKIIFPFLSVHVPRLGPVIRLLHSDHEELEKHLCKLRERLSGVIEISRKNASEGARLTREIQEMGSFMIQFISNHLKAEDSIIHGSIKRELRPDEEKALLNQMVRLTRRRRVHHGKKKG